MIILEIPGPGFEPAEWFDLF